MKGYSTRYSEYQLLSNNDSSSSIVFRGNYFLANTKRLLCHPLFLVVIFLISTIFLLYFSSAEEKDVNTGFPLIYRTLDEDAFLNCPSIINASYNPHLAYFRTRISRPFINGSTLNTSCEEIRNRLKAFETPNLGFPVAYAKLVYRDYDFLEEQLAVSYVKENSYCFSIDSDAHPTFKKLIKNLAQCVSNVFLTNVEYNLDSAGHFNNHAQIECIKASRHRPWKYTIFMQNHDVLFKTHKQITDILRIFGENEWKAVTVSFTKGTMQAAISREAADFILDEIQDIEPLLQQLNEPYYGVDEMFWPTLNTFDKLKIPGGFTTSCVRKGRVESVIRFQPRWYYPCRSGVVRHNVCILGFEYLSTLDSRHEIMANKMMPNVDYGAVTCLSELLWMRNNKFKSNSIGCEFYEQLNFVRYHHERSLIGSIPINFNCSTDSILTKSAFDPI